jgi:Family of unknown function (DUF6518)
MTETDPVARRAGRGHTGGAVRAIVPAALAGMALAVVVVYAYYNNPWRPLAHVLGPWVVLAVAVAFRRPPMLAIGASVASLAAAVVTFYIGLKVGHDIRWAGTASVMPINWGGIQLWLVLAAVAGAVFGLLGSNVGRPDWRGAAATAAPLGLLLGEVYRRLSGWGPDVAVSADVLLAIVLFATATRVNRRPLLTLLLTVVATVAGFVVVSAPDLLEQLLIEGL